MSVINIKYNTLKRDEAGFEVDGSFVDKEYAITYSEHKTYIKNENGPVTTNVYTAIDRESHTAIQHIIADNPKIISINGGAETVVKNIFIVKAMLGDVGIYNLEINEPLVIGQPLV
ncbi:MAG: hypothetical protein ACRC92_24020 [Peptostreptococcaceae bacterium]